MAVVRQINRDQITDSKPTFRNSNNRNNFYWNKRNGMITTSLASASSFENMTPSGQRNNVFALMQLRLQYGQFLATIL
jgi:hypothetical protein